MPILLDLEFEILNLTEILYVMYTLPSTFPIC